MMAMVADDLLMGMNDDGKGKSVLVADGRRSFVPASSKEVRASLKA